MKNGQKSNWSRRSFLKTVGIAIIGSPFIKSCVNSVAKLMIKLSGTNHILGHKLRFNKFPEPTSVINIPYVIIGGGISGLSAARELNKNNINDFVVLELESVLGGNSASAKNDFSEYPLGAHYLPIPNKADTQLLDFLAECDIVSKINSDYVPNPDHLCYAPQERLFINNVWQEGLTPNFGMDGTYFEQLEKFEKKMLFYRNAKDANGLYWFDIPLKKSSKNPDILALDKITFYTWLTEQNITHPDLILYINYCCRDDFGLGVHFVSAWAGIHYFAARKHDLTQGDEKVFTWPEGNGKLVKHLEKYVNGKIKHQNLVYKVKTTTTGAEVYAFDEKNNKTIKYVAQKVLVCTPQYVNQYLFSDRETFTKKFNYAPWLLATLNVTKFPLGEGAALSWDNVLHNGKGLGYIYNQNQTVNQYASPFVITYYYSFNSDNLKSDRKFLYENNETYWTDFVISDLEKAHYQIKDEIKSVEIYKRGHGMISPVPDFIFSEEIALARQNINQTIFFAHSDLSGISIFEEAFHQGIDAVHQSLK